MSTWHSLNLGDGVEAFQPTHRLQDAWMAAAQVAGRHGTLDASSAIFSAGGGESVTVYFTPAAQLIAKAFRATPCDKPSGDGIGLLVGDQRAWDIHFPEVLERRRRNRS